MYLLGEHLRAAAECLKTLDHHIYERRKLAGECTNDGFLGGDRRKKTQCFTAVILNSFIRACGYGTQKGKSMFPSQTEVLPSALTKPTLFVQIDRPEGEQQHFGR